MGTLLQRVLWHHVQRADEKHIPARLFDIGIEGIKRFQKRPLFYSDEAEVTKTRKNAKFCRKSEKNANEALQILACTSCRTDHFRSHFNSPCSKCFSLMNSSEGYHAASPQFHAYFHGCKAWAKRIADLFPAALRYEISHPCGSKQLPMQQHEITQGKFTSTISEAVQSELLASTVELGRSETEIHPGNCQLLCLKSRMKLRFNNLRVGGCN